MKVAGGAVTATGAAPPATGVRTEAIAGAGVSTEWQPGRAARHAGLGRAGGYSGA